MATPTGGRNPGDADVCRPPISWPLLGAVLAPLLGAVAGGTVVGGAVAAGVVMTGSRAGDDGENGSTPGPRLLPVGHGPRPARPGVLLQVRAGSSDPHFEVWCGSARGIPDLLEADSFVIQWGDQVAPDDLPLIAYAKDIAPRVEVTDEYGGYTVAGATGDEQWFEATIYCMDPYGTSTAALPAVLDKRLYGS